MSTPSQSNLGGKRKLLPQGHFQKLTQRTEETGDKNLQEARQIDISKIDTNPRQPRHTFDELKLKELSQDIQARGILQPPIVRPITDDRYEIVVGERRYQAAKMAGLKEIPVLVRELNDQEAEITSLVENIQREDLTIADEVGYFKMLQKKHGYSIRELAEEVAHKSPSYVEVRLKLADFPDILIALQDGRVKLSEANQLMRLGLNQKDLRERLERLKSSLDKSQSVFSKDTSLEKSQIDVAKKTPPDPHSIDSRLAQPFLKIAREIQLAMKLLQNVELSEKQAVLESIEQVERELRELKRQLKAK